jgi:predicted dehydrogenase
MAPTNNLRLDRRSFLASSSAALAAAATLPIARAAHAAGGDTIKVALIGCGGRGTGAAVQALSTEGPVKLWAMADLFADKLEKSLESLTKGQSKNYDRQAHGSLGDRIDVPPERRFVGFDAYRRAIDSGIDVAILTTAPHFRPIHFAYAVAQGKHAFMEKPVAVDAPGIRMVLAAAAEAKRKNLKVGVGFQRHHQDVYLETIKRLADGAIGPILYMRAYWNGTGYRDRGPRDAGVSEMTYQLRNPYHYTWISGDHIVEQHCHNLDVCNWIKGTHPVSAQGQGGRQVRVGPTFGDIFDHHFVEFNYADGSQLFSQCRHITGCWNSVSEHAIGCQGKADVGAGQIEGSNAWRYRSLKKANPYQVEHDALFDAIRTNTPYNEAEYGATSTMTGIMGRMAVYSGKMVTWDEALNSQLALAPKQYAFDATPPSLPGKNGLYPCAMPGVTKAW